MAPVSNPASDRLFPTKKSLRIWARNKNNENLMKRKPLPYVYPRTVEVAKDPFICRTGQNKQFFMIAIGLFPDNKIRKPEVLESELEDVAKKTKESETSARPAIRRSRIINLPRRKRQTRRYKKAKLIGPSPTKSDSGSDSISMKSLSPPISNSDSGIELELPIVHCNPPNPKYTRKAGSGRRISKTSSLPLELLEVKVTSKLSVSTSDSAPTPGKRKVDKTTMGNRRQSISKTPEKQIPIHDTFDVANNWSKIIQACSETGLISFNLTKTPRRSS